MSAFFKVKSRLNAVVSRRVWSGKMKMGFVYLRDAAILAFVSVKNVRL